MKTNHSVDHLDIRFSSTDANNSLANERHSGVVKSTVYGYIRVSTREQNEARQVDAMERFGVDRVMMDKQSGKNFDRPAYQRLLRRLKPGDVLVVKSIDRLGRNYRDILEQWRIITKEKQVAIVVIDMPLLDTRSNRDLTGTLIADIVLELLSYVAETERAFIKQRRRVGGSGLDRRRGRNQKGLWRWRKAGAEGISAHVRQEEGLGCHTRRS